jgi:hypothetical protein
MHCHPQLHSVHELVLLIHYRVALLAEARRPEVLAQLLAPLPHLP